MENHINELFRISKDIDLKDFIHEIQQIGLFKKIKSIDIYIRFFIQISN